MTYEEIEGLSPAKFEKLVVLALQKLGYETTHISLADDIGIDIIAKKSDETIAVQVKKYENRRINLAMATILTVQRLTMDAAKL